MARIKRLGSIALLLSGIFFLSSAGTSSAQNAGPCNASLNGVSADNFSTSGSALEVPFDGAVIASFSSDKKITGHKVTVEFIGGIPFEAASGVDDGNSWSESIAVAPYARYGVGLYRVTAHTFGEGACTKSGYVMVKGKNPLTTPVGAGAAAATVIGAAGMIGAAAIGSRKGPDLARQASQMPPASHDYPYWRSRGCIYGCIVNVPLALLQTGAYMVCGAGGIGAPVVVLTPYFSISSMAASVLAGLGTLILGQQYGLFFPTIVFALVWMAGWLAAGVIITLLSRLVAVRKANAILAQGKMTGAETQIERPGDE